MKQVLIGAIALVLGILVGSVWPLSEARALQERVRELEERECKPRVGSELARVFRGQSPVGPGLSARRGHPAAAGDDEEADGELHEEEGPVSIQIDAGDERFDQEDRDVALGAAREAMALRRVQARAALEEDAWPDDEQLDEFDLAVGAMNDDLTDLAEGFVEGLAERDPSRREMMVFAADVLDVFIEADDHIASTFDAEQLEAAADESVDPFSYVDPGLVDLFMELDR